MVNEFKKRTDEILIKWPQKISEVQMSTFYILIMDLKDVKYIWNLATTVFQFRIEIGKEHEKHKGFFFEAEQCGKREEKRNML